MIEDRAKGGKNERRVRKKKDEGSLVPFACGREAHPISGK